MQGQVFPLSNLPEVTYQRPSDWLTLPIVSAGQETFVGLFAVFDTPSNYVALQFEGDYVVDWGDGLVENVSSGVQAEHNYSYSDLSPSSLSSRGYRQAIVTVTPQSGSDLTTLSLDVRHSEVPVDAPAYWLDITLSMPNAATGTSLVFRSVGTLNSLEVVKIVDSGFCNNFYELFYNFASLKDVTIERMDSVEDIGYMFENCQSLFSVSLPDCPSLIYNSSPFANCYSLQKLVVGDISSSADVTYFLSYCYGLRSVTIKSLAGDASSFFEGCYSLKEVNLLDVSDLEIAENFFYECYSLEKFYLKPSPNLWSAQGMFNYCYSLKKAQLTNLDGLTNAYSMFENCPALTDVRLPEMPVVDFVEYMFEDCTSLATVELPSLLGSDSFTSVFGYCYGLVEITIPEIMPLSGIDYVSAYSYGLQRALVRGQPGYCAGAFEYCHNLRSVVFEDCSGVFDTTNMFYLCHQLSSLRVPDLVESLDVSDCLLSREALVQVFEDLGTVVGKTLTITGNWGTSLLSPADLLIASSKGWSVTT